MEGIVIWIVIIIGWAILKGIFSSGGDNNEEARREILAKLKLQLKVIEEGLPPKENKLGDLKCIAVKVKGLIGNPP